MKTAQDIYLKTLSKEGFEKYIWKFKKDAFEKFLKPIGITIFCCYLLLIPSVLILISGYLKVGLSLVVISIIGIFISGIFYVLYKKEINKKVCGLENKFINKLNTKL